MAIVDACPPIEYITSSCHDTFPTLERSDSNFLFVGFPQESIENRNLAITSKSHDLKLAVKRYRNSVVNVDLDINRLNAEDAISSPRDRKIKNNFLALVSS